MREQDWPHGACEAVWEVLYSELPKTAADDLTRSVLAALTPHVTPNQALRELAEKWRSAPTGTDEELESLNWCVAELREVIDRV